MRANAKAKLRAKLLDVIETHQLRVARQTLKYSDWGARIMGGQTKDEAREVVRRLGGGASELRRLEPGRGVGPVNPKGNGGLYVGD